MKRFQIRWPDEWLRRTRLFRTDLLSYSGKDFIISVSLYLISVVFCLVLRNFDPNNDTSYVSMIFLLDVFLTALLTDGFFFSLTIAVFAVLSVDYIFTPPFWEVSFTLAGFPLTFLVMMTICVATGIVTSRAKKVSEMEREAEREKIHSNLLRAVSHDIRTPLTGIVGATNVLLEQDDVLTPQQRRELLKNANEEAQWLIHIVENLLSITRIGAGEDAQVTKTPEAAEEVIEGAVGKFRRQYPQIDVRVELPEEFFLVPMDPLLIQQVMTNLLENAAVHGVTTTRVVVSLEKRGKWARFTVCDNGRGIPEGRLHNLFDGTQSAQKGDSTRSMGIGLSVCKTVVAAHCGKIKGENIKGGGARFTVDLPLEEDEHEDQG
ncbi:MAG: ATP-binding protein [Oscillospiraceae bacterium]